MKTFVISKVFLFILATTAWSSTSPFQACEEALHALDTLSKNATIRVLRQVLFNVHDAAGSTYALYKATPGAKTAEEDVMEPIADILELVNVIYMGKSPVTSSPYFKKFYATIEQGNRWIEKQWQFLTGEDPRDEKTARISLAKKLQDLHMDSKNLLPIYSKNLYPWSLTQALKKLERQLQKKVLAQASYSSAMDSLDEIRDQLELLMKENLKDTLKLKRELKALQKMNPLEDGKIRSFLMRIHGVMGFDFILETFQQRLRYLRGILLLHYLEGDEDFKAAIFHGLKTVVEVDSFSLLPKSAVFLNQIFWENFWKNLPEALKPQNEKEITALKDYFDANPYSVSKNRPLRSLFSIEDWIKPYQLLELKSGKTVLLIKNEDLLPLVKDPMEAVIIIRDSQEVFYDGQRWFIERFVQRSDGVIVGVLKNLQGSIVISLAEILTLQPVSSQQSVTYKKAN